MGVAFLAFPGGASGKEPTYQFRRHRETGLIPGSGGAFGEERGSPSSLLA